MLGIVSEIRGKHALVQDSYAYLAELHGEKGAPDFTFSEIEHGFKIEWMPLSIALEVLASEITENYQGNFVVERDTRILKEAQTSLEAILL